MAKDLTRQKELIRLLTEAQGKLATKDFEGALASLQPLLEAGVEPFFRAQALKVVSMTHLLKGDHAAALEALDEAVACCDPADAPTLASMLERRGMVRQMTGDLAGARVDLGRAARALEPSKGKGETHLRSLVEDSRGALAAAAGELERAVSLHLTAASLRRGERPPSLADGDRPPTLLELFDKIPSPAAQSDDAALEARFLVNAAGAAHLVGARPVARGSLERALALLDRPGAKGDTRALRAEALHNLGVVLSDLNEHGLAVARLEAALVLDTEGGQARDVVATRLRLALALRRKGDALRARAEAEEARALARKTNDRPLTLEAALEVSAAALAAGDPTAALVAAKEAMDGSEKDLPQLHARATLHAASCAKALGKKDAAREGFGRARDLAKKSGDKLLAAAAEREIAALLTP